MPSTKPARPKLLNNREWTRMNTKEKQTRIFTDLHDHFLILIICIPFSSTANRLNSVRVHWRPLAVRAFCAFRVLFRVHWRAFAVACCQSPNPVHPVHPCLFSGSFHFRFRHSLFDIRYSRYPVPGTRFPKRRGETPSASPRPLHLL